jgi:hypothetical protein
MSLIHKNSKECPLSEFDSFGVPPTQKTVEYDMCTEHRPISTLSSTASIDFQVDSGFDEYIRLSESSLYFRIRISIERPLKAKVTNDDWKNISTVNNFLHSIFKQIDLSIGDRTVTESYQTYGYKCDIETRLAKSREVKKSYLTGSLWYADDPENPDGINKTRSAFLTPEISAEDQSISKELDLMGKLHLALFEQDRPLIGGCSLKLKFTPNDPAFYLMCNANVRVVHVDFTDAVLFIHRSKVSRPVVEGHLVALSKSNAIFPIRRANPIPTTINKGTMDAIIDNVYRGKLPKRAFIGLVTHAAYNGSYTLNPYNYQHFNMNYLAFYLNGVQYPEKAFQPDFKKGLYIREYSSLFEATNQTITDSCITFDRRDYTKGNVLIGVNFTPDLSPGCCATGYTSPPKYGALRIHIRFSEPLAQTINLITYLEFDDIIEINKEHSAVYNFN